MGQFNLADASHRYDGIHIKYRSLGLLAANIKSVVNPLLGLRSYTAVNQHDLSATSEINRQRKLENVSKQGRDYNDKPSQAYTSRTHTFMNTGCNNRRGQKSAQGPHAVMIFRHVTI